MPSPRPAARSPKTKPRKPATPAAEARRDRRAAVAHVHELHAVLHAAGSLAAASSGRANGAPPDLGTETGVFVLLRQALGSARAALALPAFARLAARLDAAGAPAVGPRALPDDAAAFAAEAHHFAHAALAVLTTGDRRTPADGTPAAAANEADSVCAEADVTPEDFEGTAR